jgi:hypothetical protein
MFSRGLVARFELLEVLRARWDAECKAQPLRKLTFYCNIYRSNLRWLRRIFWGQRFSDWKSQSLINVILRLFTSKCRAATASASVQVASQNSYQKTNLPQFAACKPRPLNLWNRSTANRINSPLKTPKTTFAQYLIESKPELGGDRQKSSETSSVQSAITATAQKRRSAST